MFVLGTCTQSTHATYICIYTFRYICTRPLTWINTDRQTQHWHRHRWQKGITLIMPSLPVQNEDSLVENMNVCVYCVGPSISSSQTIMLPSSYLWTPVCPVKDTWVYGPSRAQPLSVASTDCPTQARTHMHTHTQLGGTLLVCNCRSLLWSHWETHTQRFPSHVTCSLAHMSGTLIVLLHLFTCPHLLLVLHHLHIGPHDWLVVPVQLLALRLP